MIVIKLIDVIDVGMIDDYDIDFFVMIVLIIVILLLKLGI